MSAVSTFLLSTKDIIVLYIEKGARDLLTWFQSTSAQKYRKPCTYLDSDSGERQYDDTIRICNYFDNINVVFKDLNLVIEKIGPTFKNYHSIKLVDPVLLEYQKDAFFLNHTDTKRNSAHLGNLLLIPPLSTMPHKGGTLITGSANDMGTQQKISASRKNWKAVVMPLGVEHRITKVTSGTRIVIKYQIHGTKQRTGRSSGYRRVRPRRRFTNGRKD